MEHGTYEFTPAGWDVAGSEAPPPPGAVEFIDWSTFFTKDRTQAEWLHEDVLAKGRLHSIYAQHGRGKSLFTLWMAVQIVASEDNVVLYCDYEMSEDDLYDRLVDMGADRHPERLERLRYLLLPTLPDLDTPEGGDAMARVIDSLAHEFPGAHICVVIDTIGRAVRGEENSNDTMQAWYRHTGMKIKQRGCTGLRIDHAGHEGKHQRGASAKGDDVDVVWRLDLSDAGIILKADKRRMGWVPESVSFEKVTDPLLAYRPIPVAWPPGTSEMAAKFDRLGIAVDATRNAIRDALTAADEKASNHLIGKVQKFRQNEARKMERDGYTAYIDSDRDGTEEYV